jgi:hypothetical protein
MGNEPVEEEIPVEYDDLPLEVQQALSVYRMLRDEWDSMNGRYLGKSLIGINDVLEATEIELADRKFIIALVRIIDDIRSEEVNKKNVEKPVSAS